jgi:hypothetical protein
MKRMLVAIKLSKRLSDFREIRTWLQPASIPKNEYAGNLK